MASQFLCENHSLNSIMPTNIFRAVLTKNYVRNVLLTLATVGYGLSVISPALNLIEVYHHDHNSKHSPLSQSQLNQVYAYSWFNLIWSSTLLPLYIVLTFLRREHFTPLVLLMGVLCLFIRLALFVSISDPIDGQYYRFLAFYTIRLETVAISLIPTTWISGCFI